MKLNLANLKYRLGKNIVTDSSKCTQQNWIDIAAGQLDHYAVRVAELTKQLDDKDAELQTAKDAQSVLAKDLAEQRTKFTDVISARCETKRHSVSFTDKAAGKCAQCFIETAESRRQGMRGALQLCINAAARGTGKARDESAVSKIADGVFTQIWGAANLCLTEEGLDHEEQSKKHLVEYPSLFGAKYWGATLGIAAAVGALAYWTIGNLKSSSVDGGTK